MSSSLSCATSLSLGFRRSPPLRTRTLTAAPSLPPLSNLRPIFHDSWLAGAASSSSRHRAQVVFASDSSSSAPEASGKSKANKGNEAADNGPPPLTVLAAFLAVTPAESKLARNGRWLLQPLGLTNIFIQILLYKAASPSKKDQMKRQKDERGTQRSKVAPRPRQAAQL
ncbi:hypothetical protein ACMD2_18468 [Ananas comosus]|uniref:Uncharacterized protein n=1 Tax=Ananas comosus TaxID=4615 RepID=A0A199VE97_ANACO|nr:hypothetical protein ACMD2_18468 [Ananas comosus]